MSEFLKINSAVCLPCLLGFLDLLRRLSSAITQLFKLLQVCQRLIAVLVCVCSLSPIALAYEGSRDTDLIVSALPASGRGSEQAGTHTNLDKLQQQGLAIFKQLDLQGAELTFIGKVFALPTVSWSFKKSEKLETLLHSLANKSHVFKILMSLMD